MNNIPHFTETTQWALGAIIPSHQINRKYMNSAGTDPSPNNSLTRHEVQPPSTRRHATFATLLSSSIIGILWTEEHPSLACAKLTMSTAKNSESQLTLASLNMPDQSVLLDPLTS
jgi:hypothetical protein